MNKFAYAILGVSLLLATPVGVRADATGGPSRDSGWWGGRESNEELSLGRIAWSSLYVSMRDGVKLAVDIFLPEGLRSGQRLPAILHQTRYWRSLTMDWPLKLLVDEIPDLEQKRRFVAHGYAWVDVDVRGTGASYGHTASPTVSPDQIRDGGEIVDWIISQPWSNGRVGAAGVSFAGLAAEMLLVTEHPAVKAVAVQFMFFDQYADAAFPGGIYFKTTAEAWSRFVPALDSDQLPSQLPLWRRAVARLFRVGVRPVDEDVTGSMLAEALHDHERNYSSFNESATLTFRDDVTPSGLSLESLSPHTFAERMTNSHAAVYCYSGWYDADYAHSAIKRYLTLEQLDRRLTIGPWARDLDGTILGVVSVGFRSHWRVAQILRSLSQRAR